MKFIERNINYIKLEIFGKIISDKLTKKVIKNSGIILIGNVAVSILNFISFTLVVKQLGPEIFAIMVLAQTYATILNDLFNVQTWEALIKFGFHKASGKDISKIVKSNLLLDLVSACIAFLIAISILETVMHILKWDVANYYVFFLYCFTVLFNLTTCTIGIPRLYDKFLQVAKVQIIAATLKLVGVVYAMYYANTLISYVLVYCCADIFINITLSLYSLKLMAQVCGSNWWKERFQIDFDQLKFIWWTNLRTVIRVPVIRMDMIIISMVMPVKMVGIYKVYKELAALILQIGDPVNQAIYPEFSKLLGNRDIRQTANVARKTMLLMAVIALTFTGGMLLFGEFVVENFFGREYLSNINALYVMILLYGVAFVSIPINSLFIAAGFAKYSFVILLVINAVYLATAYGGGLLFGIYGIILAFAVQVAMNKGLKIYYLHKYSSDWGQVSR
ncbi:MAG: lipopolysaccharide biosynthesis protein [Thermodesulfobacteriota bacterium]